MSNTIITDKAFRQSSPHIAKAAAATTSAPPDQTSARNAIADSLDGAQSNVRNTTPGQPDIAPTSFDITGQTTDFNLIMASMQQTLHDAHINSLLARISSNEAAATALVGNLQQAQDTLAEAQQALQLATDDFARKTAQADEATARLAEVTVELKSAKGELDTSLEILPSLQQALDQAPDDPALQAAVAQQEALIQGAGRRVADAASRQDSARIQLNVATDAALTAGTTANAAIGQITAATQALATLPTTTPASADLTPERVTNYLEVLYQSMARLTQIINNANEQRLQTSLRLYQQRQEALNEQNKAKAAEYERAVEAAKSSNRNWKIAGKVFGWVAVVASAAAALATGGALSGLVALASVALMAADEGLDATGQQTLSSRFVDPAMNKIMQGMLNMVKKMHPDLDDNVAQAIAMVLTMVAIIAIAMAGAKAGGVGVDKLKAVSPGFKALAEMRLFGGAANNVNTAMIFGKALRVIEGAAVTTSATTNAKIEIQTAHILQDAKNLEADMTENKAVIAIVQQMIENLMASYVDSNPSFDLMEKMTEWIQENQAAIANCAPRAIRA